MPELVCIVCPNGCRLTVDDAMNVTGNLCGKGLDYAREELTNPLRTLTSTVRITGAALRRCPVRSRSPIPKGLIFDIMRLLDDVELASPVGEGHIVIDDVCGTGVPIVTTRSL